MTLILTVTQNLLRRAPVQKFNKKYDAQIPGTGTRGEVPRPVAVPPFGRRPIWVCRR